jgi:predicted O-methyltransferase YrrM
MLEPRIPPEPAAVIAALEQKDADERARGLAGHERLQALHPNAARALYWLALQRRPRLVVEIGTSQGYSTLWLGLAARAVGGRVITLERSPTRAARALAHFRQADLSDVIELREGSALASLVEIPGPIDFLFIDATKTEYTSYLEAALPALAVGALVVADNIVSHAEETRPYLEYLSANPAFHNLLLPVGRGLALTVYLP